MSERKDKVGEAVQKFHGEIIKKSGMMLSANYIGANKEAAMYREECHMVLDVFLNDLMAAAKIQG